MGGEERTTKKFSLSFLFSFPREKKEKFFLACPLFPLLLLAYTYATQMLTVH